MLVLAELQWPILERIPLVGDFAVSPHGISIAVGFLVGAQMMLRRAQRRGIARRHVDRIPDVVQSLLMLTALGTIVGARFFYILTHRDAFPTFASYFTIWEGGLSLLGGIAGGILFALPLALRQRLSVPLLLDSAAPGLAMGIFLGRIGDLVIGEHLGGPTSFFLGWRCSGDLRDPAAPYPYPGTAQVQGCFDAALHQTALYDFLAAGLVLAVLLVLERRPRFDGFFLVAFTVLYGAGRFLTDFGRETEALFTIPGTAIDITGSQVAVLAAIAAALAWVVVRRPQQRQPFAWDPPDFEHPWEGGGGLAAGAAEPAPADLPDEPTAGPQEGVVESPPEDQEHPHSDRPTGGYPSPDGAR